MERAQFEDTHLMARSTVSSLRFRFLSSWLFQPITHCMCSLRICVLQVVWLWKDAENVSADVGWHMRGGPFGFMRVESSQNLRPFGNSSFFLLFFFFFLLFSYFFSSFLFFFFFFLLFSDIFLLFFFFLSNKQGEGKTVQPKMGTNQEGRGDAPNGGLQEGPPNQEGSPINHPIKKTKRDPNQKSELRPPTREGGGRTTQPRKGERPSTQKSEGRPPKREGREDHPTKKGEKKEEKKRKKKTEKRWKNKKKWKEKD